MVNPHHKNKFATISAIVGMDFRNGKERAGGHFICIVGLALHVHEQNLTRMFMVALSNKQPHSLPVFKKSCKAVLMFLRSEYTTQHAKVLRNNF